MEILETLKSSKFIKFSGELINTADIVGVFTAGTMEEVTRRKRGEWQCSHGKWHGRNEKCECAQGGIGKYKLFTEQNLDIEDIPF